jgi:hypothetical protein
MPKIGTNAPISFMTGIPARLSNPPPEKKSAQACSLHCDALINKGAIITGE